MVRATHILNSGDCLYLSNSSCHCACESGGIDPVTGFHSVMLRPDSVNRVIPPTTIITKTSVDETISHIPTPFVGRTGSASAGFGAGSVAAATGVRRAADWEKSRALDDQF